MSGPVPPPPCLHLGPVLHPGDSSCRALCRHQCGRGRKAGEVRPSLDCGDHCPEYAPDQPQGEAKRPR